MIIGRCVGEAKINEVTFISTKMPEIGQYVILEYDNKKVLGMIDNLIRFNPAINEELLSEEEVENLKKFEENYIIKGKIKILGEVDNLKLPKVPPEPGTIVKIADKETLEKIFGKNEKSISIGKLLTNEEVEVFIDVNKMISRHLAILSITGAGKSNAVSVIVNELSKLGITSLIFDMHSEYVDADFSNKKILPTKINPLFLHYKEIARMMNIEETAYIQEMFFKKVFENVKEKFKKTTNIKLNSKDFFNSLIKELEILARKETSYSESIYKVIIKVEDFRDKFEEIFDLSYEDLIKLIEKGKVNILDLGSVDEEVADIFVSHILRKILDERKRFKNTGTGLSFPIFIVIEEAHILIPKDSYTFSKYWASRIAREGRKFGIGLCLVSQRPKNLDSNVLSQANNMIILKLVEPNDQKYVQAASEMLTEDFLVHLSSLNIGEAVVIGPMIKIPTLVKIHEFKGKISGKDIDFIEESKKNLKNEIEFI